MIVKGKLPGKTWEHPIKRCHERHAGDRCRLSVDHTEFLHSKNPDVDWLNGWHQCRSGCWKGEEFYTWREFEMLRQQVLAIL